jgi:hypothetical protein
MAGKAQQQPETAELPPSGPPMVPMMAGWPLLATCAVFVVAAVFQAANRYQGPFSPWWLALIGGVGTVIAAREARDVYIPEQYGNLQADLATVVSTLIGAGVTAWWVWAGHVGVVDTWAHLLLLATVATMLWWALLWNGARIDGRPSPIAPTAATPAAGIDWEVVLRRVDGGRHVLTEIEEHRAGLALICHPRDDLPKLPTYSEFMGLAPAFSTAAALAVRKRGDRLPVNAVRTSPGRDDAEYRMEITTKDVFAGATVPYRQDFTPQDIAHALDLGELEDGDRVLVTLLGLHTQIVGATGSGKTVLANNIVGRITGCGNALIWIGATDKLIPLIWPWLRCYFEGRASRPVLDYVAGMSVHRLLEMLAAAYKLACDRNAELADESKIRPTKDMPAVFVLLEETSHAMEFSKEKIETHDGLTCNVSKLIKLIVRNGRSAGVHLILMSQTALNEAFGDEAPAIKRQLSVRFCLRTNDDYDGYKTLAGLAGTVRTTLLTGKTMLFQQVREDSEVARAIPAKAALLDGTQTITHIAERHAQWRPEIEADLDLGEAYAHRWDEDMHPELSRVVRKYGLTWRQPGPPVFVPADPITPPTTAPVPTSTTEAPIATPPEGDPSPAPKDDDVTRLFDDIISHLTVRDPRQQPPRPERAEDDGSVLGLPRPENSALFRTLDDLTRNPKGVRVPADEPALPSPIGIIRGYLKTADPSVRFFLTSELAAVCGYESTAQMGLDIYRHLKINSRNPRVDERRDTRNKGYNRRELHEAIERMRFGM